MRWITSLMAVSFIRLYDFQGKRGYGQVIAAAEVGVLRGHGEEVGVIHVGGLHALGHLHGDGATGGNGGLGGGAVIVVTHGEACHLLAEAFHGRLPRHDESRAHVGEFHHDLRLIRRQKYLGGGGA